MHEQMLIWCVEVIYNFKRTFQNVCSIFCDLRIIVSCFPYSFRIIRKEKKFH
jgi:hypothetical protein